MCPRLRTLIIVYLIVVVFGFLTVSAETKSLSDLGFVPCGWMGDSENVVIDEEYQLTDSDSNSNESVIRIEYKPKVTDEEQWAGIYWLLPECNWGDESGINLKNFTQLSFMVKGDKGGEKMEFKVGGVEGKFFDSISPAKTTDLVTLTNDWKKFSIDLKNNDLSNVLGGFCWVVKSQDNQKGCTFYLKEIEYE